MVIKQGDADPGGALPQKVGKKDDKKVVDGTGNGLPSGSLRLDLGRNGI
jgi:hypothetical protein